jgi:hypothetical protein
MGQEFVIKSTVLEDKINQLLPSQGGAQAGVDLSASTTIIPIVDLTESAEGSNLRQDLQTAMSLTSATSFSVNNTTSTLINTTGYFRVFGIYSVKESSTGSNATDTIQVTDGTTTKILLGYINFATTTADKSYQSFDFVVFLQAGESLTITSANANGFFNGSTRQIANLAGNLVNP